MIFLFCMLCFRVDLCSRVYVQVENRFGIAQLLDWIPLLYHLGDWKEACNVMTPRLDQVPAALVKAAVHLLNLVSDNDASNSPMDDALIKETPFVRDARSRMHEHLGDADACRLLRERPLTYAMACVIEVLGRWQHKGIPVSKARIAAAPPPHLLRTLTRQQQRDYTEPATQAMAEHVPRLRRVVDDEPRLNYLVPILSALVEDTRPALPPTDVALLREPLHRHLTCSSYGCSNAMREDGRPLHLCGGDCGGLARYCSAEHQKAHWPVHKVFCKRAAK